MCVYGECVCVCVCVCVSMHVKSHLNHPTFLMLLANLLPTERCFGSTRGSAAVAERSEWHPSQPCPALRTCPPTVGYSPASLARGGLACGIEPGVPLCMPGRRWERGMKSFV